MNLRIYGKGNRTLNGSWRWKETMNEFPTNTVRCLKEYYRRENSGSGFSADKKLFGWSIAQKREEKIGYDRLHTVQHRPVAQPVQSRNTVEFCPTP